MEPLSASGISKSFPFGFLKKQTVLQDVSLSVEQGTVAGFLGINGAGKSTFINLVMGFTWPDKGTISLQGLSPHSPSSRAHVGYLPENPRFYENLTAWEMLLFAGRVNDLTRDRIQQRGNKLLAQLGLEDAARQQVRTFSKGMKQRLGLVLAMIHDPAVYILDEPMSGLDPLGRQMVKDIILAEKKRGKTVFFSTHILNDVETLCDRIDIIKKGTVIYSGTLDDFLVPGKDFEASFIACHEVGG